MSINPLDLFYSRLKRSLDRFRKKFTDTEVLDDITRFLDERSITTVTAQELYDRLSRTPEALIEDLERVLEEITSDLKVIQLPKTSQVLKYEYPTLTTDALTEIWTIEGQGETEYIFCGIEAVNDSEECYFYVYCDGEIAYWTYPLSLSGWGFASGTPNKSLLVYNVNGNCAFLLTMKFEFQESLTIYAKRKAGAGDTIVHVKSCVRLIE